MVVLCELGLVVVILNFLHAAFVGKVAVTLESARSIEKYWVFAVSQQCCLRKQTLASSMMPKKVVDQR